jgi:hypothetical protein
MENFENSNFEFLRAFRRTLAEANRNEINFTGAALCWLAPALSPCSLASPRSTPAPPVPNQARRSGGKARFAPRAPSQSPSSLHDADHLGGARADTQHSAAEPAPSQHAPEAAVTGASSKRSQDPRAGELLVALFLDAPAYKKPLRSNGDTHLTPSYLPDTLV